MLCCEASTFNSHILWTCKRTTTGWQFTCFFTSTDTKLSLYMMTLSHSFKRLNRRTLTRTLSNWHETDLNEQLSHLRICRQDYNWLIFNVTSVCVEGPWLLGSSTHLWVPNPSCVARSPAWCPSSCVSVAITLRLCPVLLKVSSWGFRNASTSLEAADGTVPPSRTTWPSLAPS